MSTPAIVSKLRAGPPFLPLLFLLFLGSGCSALIYEIVWFQLLEFSVGSSAISLGVLLGTFMGGLCLGSLLFPRLVPTSWHPLRTYAFLELGIGLLGVLITLAMPLFDGLYASIAHGSASGVPLRAVVAAICLLPPTMLMGATLPAISRWIENTPSGISWLGFFYGGNTIGAVAGCLLAGYCLLPNYDMATSTYIAALINLVVAGLGIAISFAAPYERPALQKLTLVSATASPIQKLSSRSIHVAVAFSGMAALGGEVVWTRLLSLLFGGTVYTFSLILAVFLLGLAIGSSLGAMWTRAGVNARFALAWCQILCAVAIAWTSYAVTQGVPFWPVDSAIAVSEGFRFQTDIVRCIWAILPPTILWGASFPLALAAVIASAPPGRDPAKSVGTLYAANTVGAIAGALFFSLWSVKHIGSQNSQHILIAIAGLAAYTAVFPAFIPDRSQTDAQVVASNLRTAFTHVLATIIPGIVICGLVLTNLDAVPWQLIAWGRNTPTLQLDPTKPGYDATEKLFVGEGLNSSVAVTRRPDRFLQFHVAGKVEASTIPDDMRLQLMLGHYPSLFHPEPRKKKKVLIVGCGAGVTAGSFRQYPHEKIVICELEPLVPQVVAVFFGIQNNFVLARDSDGSFSDSTVQVVYDDARHYILTTDEKFDIITSDPIHPWVKGAASLYTREYFDLVKKHLNPGGIVTQWVPLYESNPEVVKSEVKTFFEAFPNGSAWLNNAESGAGYDSILVGSDRPMTIDVQDLQQRLSSILLTRTLGEVRLGKVSDIFATFAGTAADLEEWSKDGQTNHDSNLRLQYLAGRALNNDKASLIRDQMLHYRKFPENLFKVNDVQRAELEQSWGLRR